MIRIFIRICLGLLAAVLVSTIAATKISGIRMMHEWEEDLRASLDSTISVLNEATRTFSDEEFDALTRRLSKTDGVDIEILKLSDPRISEEARKRLSAQKTVSITKDRWRGKKNNEAGKHFGAHRTVFIRDWENGERRDLTLLALLSHENRVVAMKREPPWIAGPHVMPIILAIAFVSVFIVGYFLSRGLVKGLRRLENTAQKIAEGDLSARAQVRSKDAIGSLAATFNNMTDRIEELLDNQRQIVQAVAHELRTPISRVRFGMEMRNIAASEEEALKRARDIESDLDELDGLVEELLVFSRYDSGRATLSPAPVDVRRLINALFDRLTPLYPGIHFDLVTHDAKELEAKVDPRSLDRVVHNLVSNAARYAKEKVVVHSELRETELVIRVDDDGPGIPEGDRERIFEPFTRLDQSRNRASGGAGLGLAIVQRIMKANGGTVEVGTSSLGGASFSTHWPIA